MKRFIQSATICSAVFLVVACLAVPARAETFTWTQTATGGDWTDVLNWSGPVAANGDGNTADFSTLDLTGINTVHLDAPVTLGNLIYGDVNVHSDGGRWVLDNDGNPANVLTLAGTTPTITVGKTPWHWIDASINTIIAGTSGLTKDGPGILILKGSVANTYTGATTVNGPAGTNNSLGLFSTLKLDFGSMGTPTDMISSTSPLVMGGGILEVRQKNSNPTSQTFAGTTIGAGGSTITATNNNGSGVNTLTVALGAITRNASGFVNFRLPNTGQGNITTSTANDTSGILGTWATTGTGTALQYAANDGGNIVAYTGAAVAAPDLSDVTSATTNYEFSAGTILPAPTTLTGNTLRYTGGAATLDIGADANTTNTLTLNGLMNAGSGQLNISRSSIGDDATGGLVIGADKELVIVTNNQNIRIDAPIMDGAGAGGINFSSSEGKQMDFRGEIAYTGRTVVSSGTLFIRAADNFYANGASIPIHDVTIQSGATLMGSRSYFVGNLTMNGGTWYEGNGWGGGWTGPIVLNATSTFYSHYSGQRVDGDVSGSGGLIKTGRDNTTLYLNGTCTYEGPTIVKAGTLALAQPAALYNGDTSKWTATNISVADGAALRLNVGGPTDFTTTQLNALLTNLGTATEGDGFKAGSTLAIDTGNAAAPVVISANIADSTGPSGGALNLFQYGNGTLQLTGDSTFTGKINVEKNGYLSVSSFNSVATDANLGTVHAASSSLGAPTTVENGTIHFSRGGYTFNAGIIYTGTGETTDRVINLHGGTPASLTLDQSGTGLLKFVSSFTAVGSNSNTYNINLKARPPARAKLPPSFPLCAAARPPTSLSPARAPGRCPGRTSTPARPRSTAARCWSTATVPRPLAR